MRELSRELRLFGLLPKWVRYDRTNRGWHIIIRVNRDLVPLEVVALQTVLGSDRKREAFNLARVMAGGGPKWNILFERKLR